MKEVYVPKVAVVFLCGMLNRANNTWKTVVLRPLKMYSYLRTPAKDDETEWQTRGCLRLHVMYLGLRASTRPARERLALLERTGTGGDAPALAIKPRRSL